ncbi:MAG: hypothetical protein ACPGPE_16250, partial [Planctomycetota bacterium]
GGLGLRMRHLVLVGMGFVTVGALAIGGTRAHLARGFTAEFGKQDVLATMESAEPSAAMALLVGEVGPNPAPLAAGESRLDRVRRRSVPRVGVAMDHRLAICGPIARPALEVGVGRLEGGSTGMDLLGPEGMVLEFVPLDLERLQEQAEQHAFDAAVSGIVLTLRRSERVDPTAPYLTVTAALAVEVHRRAERSSLARTAASEGLGIAVWRRATRPNASRSVWSKSRGSRWWRSIDSVGSSGPTAPTTRW